MSWALREITTIVGGEGRGEVVLKGLAFGDGLLIMVFNPGGIHLGAVALAEYDGDSGRVSVSLLTRRGHKDDEVARRVAYAIAKGTARPVCVVCGIHLDEITGEEIQGILLNADKVAERFLEAVRRG